MNEALNLCSIIFYRVLFIESFFSLKVAPDVSSNKQMHLLSGRVQ